MFILAISPGSGLEPSRWEQVLGSGIDAFMIREPALPAAGSSPPPAGSRPGRPAWRCG